MCEAFAHELTCIDDNGERKLRVLEAKNEEDLEGRRRALENMGRRVTEITEVTEMEASRGITRRPTPSATTRPSPQVQKRALSGIASPVGSRTPQRRPSTMMTRPHQKRKRARAMKDAGCQTRVRCRFSDES